MVGGLLVVYCSVMSGKGVLSANGSKSADPGSASYRGWPGGSSGGGSINIFYKDSLSFEGSFEVFGGSATVPSGSGSWLNTGAHQGGAGGKGSYACDKLEEN